MQCHVRDKILEIYPELTLDDVRSTSMGTQGVDVQLSPAAKDKFPFDVECKSRRTFDTLYGFLEQIKVSHKNKLTPMVVLRGDRRKPLLLMEFDDFMRIWKELNTNNEQG